MLRKLKIGLFAALLCLLVSVGRIVNPIETKKDRGAVEMVDFAQRIRQLKFEYMNYCWRSDQWWLSEPVTSAQAGQTLPIIARHGNQLLKAASMISASSAEGQKIVDYFNPLGVAVVDDQGLRFLAKREQTPKLYICFIPRSLKDRQPSSCWYNGDTINVFAVEWSKPVLAAFVGHELGHAYRHRLQGSRATSESVDSNSRIDEEIWAHTFEAQILNHQSSRQFYKIIDRLIDQMEAKSWAEAISSLTLSDLKGLDKTLDVSGCDIMSASLLLDEYFLIVGFRFIDRTTFAEEQKQQQKRDLYRRLP